MRIALVQMASRCGDVAWNVERCLARLREARDRGADLALFPELCLTGIMADEGPVPAAVSLGSPAIRAMAECARRGSIAACFGFAERSSGKPYVSQALLDRRGRLAGLYRKIHVTPRGRAVFRPGGGRPVFSLEGVRVAIAICADVRDASLFDGYGRRRVGLMLLPFAWDADPILKSGKIACWKDADEMRRAHAEGRVVRYRTHDEMTDAFRRRIAPLVRRNGFFAAFVNAVGRPHPLRPFVGPSFALDPLGRLLARSRGPREEVVLADLDVE